MDTQTIPTDQAQTIQIPEKAVTCSLWAACFAVVRGAKLLEILPRTSRYTRFAFLLSDEGDVARMAFEEYRWGNPSVPLRDLIDARAELLHALDIANPRTATIPAPAVRG